ncbi:MAG: hypothetical protein MR965_01055 [Lachnospiraceae bacterium]|nr:hypothetical protein [Lachnospiraceae bacterium]
MKKLRKQHWLILCILFFVLISAIGTDVARISQINDPHIAADDASLSEISTLNCLELDLCSSEQLGIRMIQPRSINFIPTSLRSDIRQQQLFLLLILFLTICSCHFFVRHTDTLAFYVSLTHQLEISMHYIHAKDGSKVLFS